MKSFLRMTAVAVAAAGVTGCAWAPGIALPKRDAALVQGPPISDIVTPFDYALQCLKGKIQPSITFSVGAIVDLTGKEQLTDGGAGKFITQGAGDIVQSALFKAGATVLNRRDPRVMEMEVNWGIRDAKKIVPSNLYITGSINSLDFIPGSGAEVRVAGVGPRYRQNRMLVGLDLAMTEAVTGRVVANVPLQKQIFASEAGIDVGRFVNDPLFGKSLLATPLIDINIGGREREALHYALRQMLNLATFELLSQVMSPSKYWECREQIERIHGFVDHTVTAERAKEAATSTALAAAVTETDTSNTTSVVAPTPLAPKPSRQTAAAATANNGERTPYWSGGEPSENGRRAIMTD
jgi:curli biogenesis system outer membrane secretion channel CsgG